MGKACRKTEELLEKRIEKQEEKQSKEVNLGIFIKLLLQYLKNFILISLCLMLFSFVLSSLLENRCTEGEGNDAKEAGLYCGEKFFSPISLPVE